MEVSVYSECFFFSQIMLTVGTDDLDQDGAAATRAQITESLGECLA